MGNALPWVRLGQPVQLVGDAGAAECWGGRGVLGPRGSVISADLA